MFINHSSDFNLTAVLSINIVRVATVNDLYQYFDVFVLTIVKNEVTFFSDLREYSGYKKSDLLFCDLRYIS